MSVYIIDNFLSDDILEKAVAIFDEAEKNDRIWNLYEGIKSAKKIIIKRDQDYLDVQQHFTDAENYLDLISKMCIEKHKELNKDINNLYTHAAYMVVWRDDKEMKLGTKLHVDDYEDMNHLIYTTVIYINDSYEGGEISFPDFDIFNKPKPGQAAFFKSNVPHQVLPYSGGDRKVIILWHTYDQSKCWFDKLTS